MTPLEIEFIEQTIGSQQKQFYYFRDKYALQLIQYHVKESTKIDELRRSQFQSLLNKTILKEVMKECGNGRLHQHMLENVSSETGLEFSYNIARWGGFTQHRKDEWYQTSRPGLNLVLRLNFDDWHNYKYCELIKPSSSDHPYVYGDHPVSTHRQLTMAWIRLDVDLDAGEVLIEEIQNDWLREVSDLSRYLQERGKEDKKQTRSHWFFDYCSPSNFKTYADFLTQYQKIWDEASLSLAIHFIKQELGISTIYYHQFDSGNLLKGLEYSKPPRSLYTKLPKRFCFKQTDRAPEMLRKDQYLKKILRKHALKWWKLTI